MRNTIEKRFFSLILVMVLAITMIIGDVQVVRADAGDPEPFSHIRMFLDEACTVELGKDASGNYIWDSYNCNESNPCISYVKIFLEENETVVEPGYNSEAEDCVRYLKFGKSEVFTVAQIDSDGLIYRITRNDDVIDEYRSFGVQYSENGEVRDEYIDLTIFFGGEPWEWVPDQFQYQGEDGRDWIGYSGCFITEAAYISGNPWNDDVKLKAFPDNIVYYVHANTIQGVVDELLKIADTDVDVVDMWDHGNPTKRKLVNSGYILLNVSCREAATMETLPAEEYVYAPASVRGVLLNASSNGYMIGDCVENSETVYEVEVNNSIAATSASGVSDNDAKTILHGVVVFDIDRLQENWGNIGFTNPENQQILEKATYNSAADKWEKTGYYYAINNNEIKADPEGHPYPLDAFAVNFKNINRWPTLHVNASTQVKVEGAWKDGAKLYIGFYEGESASTEINGHHYTISDVGRVHTEEYSVGYDGYDVTDGVIKHQDVNTSVEVHVVKAESKKNVNDTYAEGGQKTEICVDEKAVSDLIRFTGDEKNQVIDGATLDLDLSVAKVDNTSDNAAITNAISGIEAELARESITGTVDYIDANLSYKIKANGAENYGSSTAITETNELMTISVPISSELSGKSNYVVFRYHDGKVDRLPVAYDEARGMLTFDTDRFSVYALAVDTNGPGPGPGPGGDQPKGLINFVCQSGKLDGGHIAYKLNGASEFSHVGENREEQGYECIDLNNIDELSSFTIKFEPSQGYQLDTTRGVRLFVNGQVRYSGNGDGVAGFVGDNGYTFNLNDILTGDETVTDSTFELEFGFENAAQGGGGEGFDPEPGLNMLWVYSEAYGQLHQFVDPQGNVDCLVLNGDVDILSIEYNDHTYSKEELLAFGKRDGDRGDVWYEIDPGNMGYAQIPAGALVTVKLLPDYGYQVLRAELNGSEIAPTEEQSVFTFTMPTHNLHLSAVFTACGDEVVTPAADVRAGSVQLAENEMTAGSALLTVETAERGSVFAQTMEGLDGYEITSCLDIGLQQVFYKGSKASYWANSKDTLANKATIALNLQEEIGTDNVKILHEKHNGEVEIIDATVDPATGAVVFETDSFSTYAIIRTHVHADVNHDGVCDTCKVKFAYIIAPTSRLLGTNDTVSMITMSPSNGSVAMGETVTVMAQNLLGYNFKGWYLPTDIDEGTKKLKAEANAMFTGLEYTFTPTDDMSVVAVYEAVGKATVKLNGSGFTVKIDGGTPTSEQNSSYTAQIALGSKVTVTVTDADFVSWTNNFGKIVSTSNEFTFTVTGNADYTMTKKGTEGTTAMVEFVSSYGQVIAGQIYGKEDAITMPDGPSKMGSIFTGWSLTAAEICEKIVAGETHITVTPAYEQDTSKTYTVTVWVDGAQDAEQTEAGLLPGVTKTVSAPSVDGKVFLYWTDANDNILGYNASYFMQVNKNITVKAVYGAKAMAAKPVIAMTNVFTTSADGKNKISFSATRDIPAGYTLVEHGMLCNKTGDISDPCDNSFIIGGTGVSKIVSTASSNVGVFTLNVSVATLDTKVVTRGYLIVQSNSGETEIYYTDIVNKSYNEVSGN